MSGKSGLGALLLAAAVSSAMAGCGLEEVVELFPPSDFSATGATQITLVHDTQNADLAGSSQSFKGYEIHYRLFDSQASRDAVQTSLQSNVIDSTTATPDTADAAMLNLGLVRMYGSLSSKPTLKITDATVSQSHILSAGDADWTLDGTPLYRNKSSGSSSVSFKTATAYAATDSDYTGAASPATVYYLMTATGYGINLSAGSVGTEIHSLPRDIVIGSFSPQ